MKSVDLGLVQELAHDLRTPVASLRNLIETLRTEALEQQPALREELFGMAVKETDYLTHLIEDLLLLAQVMEPDHKPPHELVLLENLAREEVELVSHRYPEIQFEIESEDSMPTEGQRRLLKRMLRNAIENAASFAKSRVLVRLFRADDRLKIEVADDGPGLSEESLLNFGRKRGTRYIGSQRDGRLSVGLGSVIMTTIAQDHRGKVSIENKMSESSCRGAVVRIELWPARTVAQTGS